MSLSLEMRLHTCCRVRPRNSSPCTTSQKCCSGRHKSKEKKNNNNYTNKKKNKLSAGEDGAELSSPAKAWAWLRSCVQVCRSAKALMPRQLVGCSCDWRNSQQTCWTSISWRRLAAASRTCRDNTHIYAPCCFILFFHVQRTSGDAARWVLSKITVQRGARSRPAGAHCCHPRKKQDSVSCDNMKLSSWHIDKPDHWRKNSQ